MHTVTTQGKIRLLLIIILALGALLRFITIDAGLPGPREPFYNSLYQDEWRSLLSIFEYRPLDPWQKFTDYTHPIIANTFFFYQKEILVALGIYKWSDAIEFFYSHPYDLTKFYIGCRVLNVIFALFTIYFTFLFGRKICNPRIGVLAAGILAVLPVHVLQTQYAKYNSFGAMMNIIVFLLALKLMRSSKLILYAIIGCFVGLLYSATWFQGLSTLWIVLVIQWTRSRHLSFPQKALVLVEKRMMLLFLCATVTILLYNHWMIFSFGHWWADFQNFFDSTRGDDVYNNLFICAGSAGIRYTFQYLLPFAMSPAFAVLFILASLYAVWKRQFIDWNIIPYLLMTYLSLFHTNFKYTRSVMHSTPLIALLIGRLIYDTYHFFRNSRILTSVLHTLFVLVFISALMHNGLFIQLIKQRDSRLKASDWMLSSVPLNTQIALLREYWDVHPPIIGKYYVPEHEIAYPTQLFGTRNYDALLHSSCQFLLTSDIELFGLYHKFENHPEAYPVESYFLQQLYSGKDFHLVYRQKNAVPFLDAFVNNPLAPLDILLINPEILIFKRN